MPTATRDNLISTAARLFHERGYHATGVAAILDAADAKPGSFYHAFASKEDLLRAVLAWYADHLRPIVMDPIEAVEPDPIERIFALLAWYRQGLVETGCRLGCPIGNLALELSDTHPELRPEIDRNFRNWAASIRVWLDAAGDRLPSGTDRHALSLFILTVMEGGLMQARAAASLAPFDAGVDVLRDHMNHLMRAGAARD